MYETLFHSRILIRSNLNKIVKCIKMCTLTAVIRCHVSMSVDSEHQITMCMCLCVTTWDKIADEWILCLCVNQFSGQEIFSNYYVTA